jgi:hypothetical protein
MTNRQIYTLSFIGGIALGLTIIGIAMSYHKSDKAGDQDRGVILKGDGGKYHCIKVDAVLK